MRNTDRDDDREWSQKLATAFRRGWLKRAAEAIRRETRNWPEWRKRYDAD